MNNVFSITVLEKFDELMKDESWRMQTIEQLMKDLRMSGISINELPDKSSPDLQLEYIARVLKAVKSNKHAWDSVNYRIDLPSNIDLFALDDDELMRLYLLRSFQKVWLRKHFGRSDSKDDANESQKHLKP